MGVVGGAVGGHRRQRAPAEIVVDVGGQPGHLPAQITVLDRVDPARVGIDTDTVHAAVQRCVADVVTRLSLLVLVDVVQGDDRIEPLRGAVPDGQPAAGDLLVVDPVAGGLVECVTVALPRVERA